MDYLNRRLFDAARAGDAAGVRTALAAGAEPDALSVHSPFVGGAALGPMAFANPASFIPSTALHEAVLRRHTDCLLLLLRGGASPGVYNGMAWTPLHVACALADEAAVAALLAAGADPAADDGLGSTAAHYAVHAHSMNSARVLRLLLAVDPAVALAGNRDGSTPLDQALRSVPLSGEAARVLLEEAPLQPVGELLEMLAAAAAAGRDVRPLRACLAARLRRGAGHRP